MNDKEPVVFPVLKNRLPAKELESQRQLFSDKNLFTELLDSTPTCLVVLNEYRQIVYVNKAFKDLLKNKDVELAYGKRPGEVLNCEHAFITPDGCGTSDFCDTCGALKVILSSLKGEEDVQECRIIQKDTNDALDLRVWSRQLKINNQYFSIFTFVDISHEKRRLALERIFFHDVLNSASALSSYFHILKDSSREEIEEAMLVASGLIDKLLEEIKAQRDLTQAENTELIVNLQSCNSLKIIKDLINLYIKQIISEEKEIEIDSNCEITAFISDELLISRVLNNMLKNALESTNKGSKIKIGCNLIDNKIRFFVNNPGYIPQKIQNQIFQRSFSTKGLGRGLGTYSMKLITERYLNGKIYFTTSEKEGTTFIAEYPANFNKHY
jgi:signal transduction histidine kinase